MDDDESKSLAGLLTADDLAKLLGFTVATVRRYATQNPDKLPPRVSWTNKQRWELGVFNQWRKERDGHVTIDEQVKQARAAVEAREQKEDDAAERPPRSRGGRPRNRH
jgi:hypothetical protein